MDWHVLDNPVSESPLGTGIFQDGFDSHVCASLSFQLLVSSLSDTMRARNTVRFCAMCSIKAHPFAGRHVGEFLSVDLNHVQSTGYHCFQLELSSQGFLHFLKHGEQVSFKELILFIGFISECMYAPS
jgi:hypothetical protein